MRRSGKRNHGCKEKQFYFHFSTITGLLGTIKDVTDFAHHFCVRNNAAMRTPARGFKHHLQFVTQSRCHLQNPWYLYSYGDF